MSYAFILLFLSSLGEVTGVCFRLWLCNVLLHNLEEIALANPKRALSKRG